MKQESHLLSWKPRHTTVAIACFLGALLSGCTNDAYDKGDGPYSDMQAELVDVTVGEEKKALDFVTDKGQRYMFETPVPATWASKADSTYRAIVYFDDLGNGVAKCRALGGVPTLRAKDHRKLQDMADDPVGYESVWVSDNQRYVNMALLLKSGTSDSNSALHKIALAQDTLICHSNGRNTIHYRLLHDQNNIPQYYTDRSYVSILLPEATPLDTVVLQMNTTDGVVSKVLTIR